MSELKPFQQRVVDEKSALDEKIKALDAFIEGDKFRSIDSDEQDRLYAQSDAMKEYSSILEERIENFS